MGDRLVALAAACSGHQPEAVRSRRAELPEHLRFRRVLPSGGLGVSSTLISWIRNDSWGSTTNGFTTGMRLVVVEGVVVVVGDSYNFKQNILKTI